MSANRFLLTGLCLSLLLPLNPAAAQSEPDTSRWRCRFCAFESGLDGNLGVDVGLVFDDAYRFGSGTGLEDEGGYLNGDLSLNWWGDGARFYEIEAASLGTRARALELSGGVQGRYQFKVAYDEIPQRLNDTGLSPFVNIGSSALSLPAGWQPAGSAKLMPDLAGSLRPFAIAQDRKRLGFELKFTGSQRWSHHLSVSREQRDGLQPFSGSFLTLATILPAPIDYETDSIEATVAYTGDQWQANLGYYGSFFGNADPALTWQNPFTPLVTGAEQGAAARPPDNDFHQLSLSGNYRLNPGMRLVGHIALGRASQDEALLPYTVNPAITPAPLPATSANAEIDSTLLSGSANLSGHLSKALRFKAFYRRHERDNQTPVLSLQPINTDVYQEAPRTNRPFSFEKSRYGLDLRYRLPGGLSASGGFAREDYRRDLQEVAQTNENSFWIRLSAPAADPVDLSFGLQRDNRNGSGYRPISSLDPPENPLLRKFNLADRDRHQAFAEIGLRPHASTSIGISGAYAKDEYPDSVIGLNASEERSLTLDATVDPMPRLSLHGFVTRQVIDYAQTGMAQTIWQATAEDEIVTGGFSLAFTNEDGSRRMGLDYSRSDSEGSNVIAPGSGLVEFPDLTADLETFSFRIEGRVRDNLRARFRYRYERFHSRDWTIERVEPATIGSILLFGERLPNYTQQILWLGLVRSF